LVIFFCLISFCSCSTKDKFASILQQFVELNDAMGVQKEDVGVIIAKVKSTITSADKSYKNFFRTLETHCASATARLNTSIKNLVSNINDASNNLNTWKKNLASAVRDEKDAAANIKSGRVQMVGLRKRVDKVTMDFKVYAAEADRKLVVVKVLRDIITDELFNKSPGALVQIVKFQQKLAELKELLNNNSDSLYSPIVTVLLDLATEQNFSDQSVLRKILQNLNNLGNALRQFRAKQEASLKSEMVSLRKQMKNVRGRIRAYRRMRAQAVSKKIDAGHYMSFYTHEISHFNAEKGRKGDELRMFKKLCAFEKRIHNEGRANFSVAHATANNLFGQVQRLR